MADFTHLAELQPREGSPEIRGLFSRSCGKRAGGEQAAGWQEYEAAVAAAAAAQGKSDAVAAEAVASASAAMAAAMAAIEATADSNRSAATGPASAPASAPAANLDRAAPQEGQSNAPKPSGLLAKLQQQWSETTTGRASAREASSSPSMLPSSDQQALLPAGEMRTLSEGGKSPARGAAHYRVLKKVRVVTDLQCLLFLDSLVCSVVFECVCVCVYVCGGWGWGR